jgi:antitoxin component YwqK of YwqJK toxin-antitoxin module
MVFLLAFNPVSLSIFKTFNSQKMNPIKTLLLTCMLIPCLQLYTFGQDAQKKAVYETKYLDQKEDKKIYLQGQSTTFTGHGVERYKSGKPKFQIEYANGIPHGLTIIWWENGKPHTQQKLNEGKQEGKTMFWFESGMKKSEADYKDGRQNGWTVFWYKSGRKRSAQLWSMGRKTGGYQEWNDAGELGKEKLKLEGEYKNGKRHGVWKYYRPDGSMQYAYQLDNGKMQRIRQWDESGQVVMDKIVQPN